MFDRERGLSKGGETVVDRKRKGKRGNWKGEASVHAQEFHT